MLHHSGGRHRGFRSSAEGSLGMSQGLAFGLFHSPKRGGHINDAAPLFRCVAGDLLPGPTWHRLVPKPISDRADSYFDNKAESNKATGMRGEGQ